MQQIIIHVGFTLLVEYQTLDGFRKLVCVYVCVAIFTNQLDYELFLTVSSIQASYIISVVHMYIIL